MASVLERRSLTLTKLRGGGSEMNGIKPRMQNSKCKRGENHDEGGGKGAREASSDCTEHNRKCTEKMKADGSGSSGTVGGGWWLGKEGSADTRRASDVSAGAAGTSCLQINPPPNIPPLRHADSRQILHPVKHYQLGHAQTKELHRVRHGERGDPASDLCSRRVNLGFREGR
jgi:hypothetical protein